MKIKTCIITLLLCLLCSMSSAQKVKNICGEYTYSFPENISLEQAKKTVIERAKIQALADEFGTTINQDNITSSSIENEKSEINFASISTSNVKGEWIKDTKITVDNPFYSEGQWHIKASVCGKAREIVNAKTDVSFKILKNGTEARFEDSNFKNGDDLYLLFQTPSSGYVAAYLVDDKQTAHCLLPYQFDKDGKVEVENNKEYVFGSKQHAFDDEAVDEYYLTCDKSLEINTIYMLFSPNPFTKAVDKKTEEILPRELPLAEFQEWLSDNLIKDRDMVVTEKTIYLSKE